ncbi:2-hydroxyacid dehydrogenase [Polaribacter sp. Hel1_85]|uniref:2-hydroxyacid dehydrogenase n=1 Tax=Polaribacter sp. Hel1_85 TaxID=1250005 RepID=UPI00052C4342|nr:2-hydroxyacid dehydrogenase [Polaribacter sp. Hel1_85]KGL62482.1 D-lactate dehydrogenase [Polaribacter sp. Hel1_85]
MKTLVYSAKDFEISFIKKANSKKHKLTFLEDSLTSESAIKAIGYKAISIFSKDDASPIVIEKLKDFGVEFITLRSVGHDNVNLNTANTLEIKVANVPAFSPYSIAEHAVSLLLTLNRKLIEANKRVKSFNFDLNNLIGFDLNDKKVGIIGTGKIGSVMTKIMHGFGCELLGYDILENKELTKKYGMQYQSIEDLCENSDIISLHVPLNSETHHLIDKNLIKLMKPGVVIINTARGAILNTEDIINGLRSGIISALGIDVYENEKEIFFSNHSLDIITDEMLIKLNAMPNVLITGHQAFLTDEALTNIAETTIYNLDCWTEGIETKNELTKIISKKK